MIDADAFNAFEVTGWKATATGYDTYWPALTSRLSDALLDAVDAGPDMRVLDVACGPGHLAARAAERGATAVGVDIADPMVKIARQRFPRAEFREGDAQALPFPDRRVVIRFDFTGRQRPERYWLLIEHGDTEICKTYPGLDEDLYITAEAEAFVKWHAGQLSWAEATRNRRIQLHGPSWLVRAFPTWNARSAFAHIKPVSRTAASLAG